MELHERNCDLKIEVVLPILCLKICVSEGLASDPSNSENENKAASHGTSSGSVGIKVAIVCLGVVAVLGFSVLLFKIWQKKKREEQHARLLKLFEDDDDLEVELGIRD